MFEMWHRQARQSTQNRYVCNGSGTLYSYCIWRFMEC